MSFFDPKPGLGGAPPPPPPPGPPAGPPAAPTDYYSKLLASDPQLQAALTQLSALSDQYGAGFGTSIQQLLEGYGAVPDEVPDALKPYVTQTTRDLAGAATSGGVSTLAQLARAAQDAHERSISSLAARGLIHSGALGQHENDDLQNANAARASALQSLLGNIGQAQQGYLGQQQQLDTDRAGATNDALNRLYTQIQGGLISAPGAPPAAPPAKPTPKIAAPRTTLPYKPSPVGILANPSGGSARAAGGIFAIH